MMPSLEISMSEHIWIHEHAETAAAGGLTPDETARFEAHIAACPACAEVATEAKKLDGALAALFADVRPSAGLEDRAVRSLRSDVRRKQAFAGWQKKLAAGLAASVGLGLAGAAIGSMPEIPYPGGDWG